MSKNATIAIKITLKVTSNEEIDETALGETIADQLYEAVFLNRHGDPMIDDLLPTGMRIVSYSVDSIDY